MWIQLSAHFTFILLLVFFFWITWIRHSALFMHTIALFNSIAQATNQLRVSLSRLSHDRPSDSICNSPHFNENSITLQFEAETIAFSSFLQCLYAYPNHESVQDARALWNKTWAENQYKQILFWALIEQKNNFRLTSCKISATHTVNQI